MRRVCIGIYYSSSPEALRKTLVQLRANTPRSAALLLLADGVDAVTSLELRAFSDVLQLRTSAWEGPAACFNRFAAASSSEVLVFVESGTLVPTGWLEKMVATFDADASDGLTLASDVESDDMSSLDGDTLLIAVRRDVVRSIGTADSPREDAGRWVPEYCRKVKSAGFGVARVNLDAKRLQAMTNARVARTFGGLRNSAVRERVLAPVLRGIHAGQIPYETRHSREANVGSVALSVAGHFNVSSGYGSMSEYLVRGLSRAGARVNVLPITLNPDGLSQEFRDLVDRSRRNVTDPVLFYSWPEPALQPFLSRPALYLYTMWESSRLPDGWAQQINRAKGVIVPSLFVADMFRESGVIAPIEVVPDGVDPEVYYWVYRPMRAGLTTLTVGPLDNRKNVRIGIAAWKEAFAGDPDARLIIKTQYNYQNYVPDDLRIRYVDVVEGTRGILHWYRKADVLLALGSEGFGLPLIEGMATGLPVVALDSEGQADVCRDARNLLLPVPAATWEAYHSHFGAIGVHGVPSVRDVADRLRWVASHRVEAAEMGRAASSWVLQHRNVWAKGPGVLDVVELYSHTTLAPRRSTVFWVPSWQSRCGIAEYTAHLKECLPGSIKVVAREPDVQGLRLLHVQHESGIFEQAQASGLVTRASSYGVPVVVTEHAVDDYIRPWEQEATALVALNTLGIAKLKARWPGKRVEYIPHGCPTWFPPRKTVRGRVIGAFGFLAPHKGYWQLLDVLRQMPGAELLLFSSSKSPEVELLWEKAAQGLPVRRVREYLPAPEIARRLAAEADLLAYWYDEVHHYSASGAVRIGLATGVPVLASPTSWFHDLQDVVFRPANLVDGMEQLFEDTGLRDELSSRACQYCHENSWPVVAERHVALWNSLT